MSSPSEKSPSAKAGTVWTVRDIRRAIAFVAILFPLVLLSGYWILEGLPFGWPLPDSVSTYFHTASMHRVYLVGLIGLGLLLIFYQYRDGSTDRDNETGLYEFGVWDFLVSTLAGLFAIGVAVFPPDPECVGSTRRIPSGVDITCPPSPLQENLNRFHHICTVGLFACIVIILLYFFTRSKGFKVPWNAPWKSLTNLPKLPHGSKKLQRNRVYIVCAVLIILGGVLEPLWARLFWGEFIALLAFGAAWLTKGELIWVDDGPLDLLGSLFDLPIRLIRRIVKWFQTRSKEVPGADEGSPTTSAVADEAVADEAVADDR
jgi:hypothetical protein